MIPIEQIRSRIEGDLFDYSQLMVALSDYRKPRDSVTALLKNGHIIRIRKGLYIFSHLWCRKTLALEPIANLVYGPSAISLEYALSWYGLIPERVRTITSVTTGRSHQFSTPAGIFTYTHLSADRFSSGLEHHETSFGKFIMAGTLKALADKVWTDKRFRPTSPASFGDYLFSDLRIEETALASQISYATMQFLAKAYSSRKIFWLMEYLQKNFKSVI